MSYQQRASRNGHSERTVKKNVTLALAVGLAISVSLKLSKIEIIIIEKLRPAQPQNIVRRRPMVSSRKLGKMLPNMNIKLMLQNH